VYSLVTSDVNCSSSPSTVQISVIGTTLEINGLPLSHCINGSSTLNVTASSASSYTWQNGSLSSSIVVSPTVTTLFAYRH
jgi:hypothetical protein